MTDKVSDLIEWGIFSGRYVRTINTCHCETCRNRRELRFTTWVNGLPECLCPLEVAMFEKTGNPLPRSEAQKILGLPQSVIDQVLYRADTNADDCIRFLRSQGF